MEPAPDRPLISKQLRETFPDNSEPRIVILIAMRNTDGLPPHGSSVGILQAVISMLRVILFSCHYTTKALARSRILAVQPQNDVVFIACLVIFTPPGGGIRLAQ
jgi:hypothetical protein